MKDLYKALFIFHQWKRVSRDLLDACSLNNSHFNGDDPEGLPSRKEFADKIRNLYWEILNKLSEVRAYIEKNFSSEIKRLAIPLEVFDTARGYHKRKYLIKCDDIELARWIFEYVTGHEGYEEKTPEGYVIETSWDSSD